MSTYSWFQVRNQLNSRNSVMERIDDLSFFSDIGFSQFGSIWRPACLLNNNLWQKWFHTDRLGIIFKHDEPLNLFPHSLSATSIQSTGMQCRQAANTLYSFLKSYCSFVLIENHSYIKFLSPKYVSIKIFFFS